MFITLKQTLALHKLRCIEVPPLGTFIVLRLVQTLSVFSQGPYNLFITTGKM